MATNRQSESLKWHNRTWQGRPGRSTEILATSKALGLRVIFHQWADEDTVTVRTVTGDAWRNRESFRELSNETLSASIGDVALAMHGRELLVANS